MPTPIDWFKDSSGTPQNASTKLTIKKCQRHPLTPRKKSPGVYSVAREVKKKKILVEILDDNAANSKNQSILRKRDRAEAGLKFLPNNKGTLATSQTVRPAVFPYRGPTRTSPTWSAKTR